MHFPSATPRPLLVFVLLALAAAARPAVSTLAPQDVAAPAPAEATGHAPGLTSTALPARQGRPAGATLFERLDAAATGVDFVHDWPRDEQVLHVLGNAMFGGGVALGDADGDGAVDLLLTRALGGQRLYRNTGGFTFADATDAAGLSDESWGNGASFADVDGDGDLDLYVCGYGRPDRLWVNQGDGTFREEAEERGLGASGASIMIAFADHDLDGDVDGYLLTNRYAPGSAYEGEPVVQDGRLVVPPGMEELFAVLDRPDGSSLYVMAGQRDRLYVNDGAGRFTDGTERAGLLAHDMGLSATWWDSDGDRLPDLYVANDFFGPDRLYRNQGDGTFVDVASTALPHTPWFSMGADAADVDGDGRLDLLATDMLPRSRLRRHTGMGELGSATWFPESVTPPQLVRNALFLNTGTERFREGAFLAGLAATDWTWSVVFGDLDEDGRQDLFVSNGMTRDFFDSDLRLAGRMSMSRLDDMGGFWLPQPKLEEANLAFRNEGELRFEEVGGEWGLGHVGVSFGAALSDLDGDGDLDVVTNDFEAPVGLYRNRAHEGHRVVVRLRGTESNRAGLGARVWVETAGGEQLREVTRARGFQAGHDTAVHVGLGPHATVQRLAVQWPSGRVSEYRDLPADRSYLVVEPGPATGDGSVAETPPASTAPGLPAGAAPEAGTRVPTFVRRQGPALPEDAFDDLLVQPLLPFRLSRQGPGVAVGDVDGDGDDDFVLGGARGVPLILFANRGDGLYDHLPVPAFEQDAGHEDRGVLFLDVDADGDLDLYAVSGGVELPVAQTDFYTDRLYLNDGQGGFTRAPDSSLPRLADAGSVVAAADIDRDGDLDLFVGGRSVPGRWPETPHSRLLRNDGGSFVAVEDDLAPGLRTSGLVTSALFADVDGDGWSDLVVAHELGPIVLWRNRAGRLVRDESEGGLAGRAGCWLGLAAGDLDGDGDLDVLAGNLGLNTLYGEGPVELFAGDLDGSGLWRVLEVVREDGRAHPLRRRDGASLAWPLVAELFPTFAAWGRAQVSDLAPPELLEAALHHRADELRTGVLRNDGSGRFSFEPLPRVAQIAPSCGTAIVDVDADGRPDLLLAQNLFATHPDSGRFDGGIGQLLLGRADGGFHPVDPAASQVVLPGDGRALAVLDVEGSTWPDLLATSNDGPFVLLQHAGLPDARMLSVRLVGRPGNPTAVGARVTLQRSDGLRQTAEVTAGGGWLSQSAPRLHFGLGETATPVTLHIRWADGSEAVFETGEDDRVVVVGQE